MGTAQRAAARAAAVLASVCLIAAPEARAAGGFVSATASSSLSGYPAGNAIDGNLSTRWAASGRGQFITGDMGAVETVTALSIAWYRGTSRKYAFQIEVAGADGTTFQPVFSGSSSGTTSAPETYSFAPVQAQFVRVVVNGNTVNDRDAIREMAAQLSSTTNPSVTVAVSPSAATVAPGGRQQFTATVTNAQDPSVTWSVAEGASGGAVDGTGLYVAPATAGTYHVVATSVADTTKSATATVTVSGAGSSGSSGGVQVLYTDLLSGPNSGGENGGGTYLSIFGKGFGTTGLGTTVQVYIGGAQVARYLSLGPSRARPDIQQITVQVGALGNPTPGTALPIDVVVNGVHSNTDQTFTVNPGDILFVDNVKGNDATAVPGDPTHPFRHVQTSDLSQGAWGKAGPGDVIVMRGTGTAWTDLGYEGYFMRFRDKSGSAPTGATGTGPIVIMGYPGEDAFVRGTLAAGMTDGCISAINGQTYPGMGQWAVISNLRIDCEGYDGPISQEIHGDHWRVVNDDLAASTAPTSGSSVPRMGGITGNGQGSVWLGNHIHDIQGSPDECHGIYIDGDGSYEIAFNNIHDIRSGNGIQVYVNGTAGSSTASNVTFHHNWVHDVNKHAINVADGSANGFRIYDNVLFNTQRAGIRFNTTILHGAQIFGNTLYATDTNAGSSYGALTNDAQLPSDALDVEDNIFWPAAGTPYTSGSVGFGSSVGTVAHNVWYGGTGTPSLDAAPILGDPGFVAPGADFHLVAGGAAVGSGVWTPAVQSALTTDFDLLPRSGSAPLDVGAYEYRP